MTYPFSAKYFISFSVIQLILTQLRWPIVFVKKAHDIFQPVYFGFYGSKILLSTSSAFFVKSQTSHKQRQNRNTFILLFDGPTHDRITCKWRLIRANTFSVTFFSHNVKTDENRFSRVKLQARKPLGDEAPNIETRITHH